MTLRARLRGLVPLVWRQAVAQLRRALVDLPQRARLATRLSATPPEWHCVVELRQQVLPSTFFDNKIANLTLAAAHISGARIEAGAGLGSLWSFWAYVGRPTAVNGFAHGRNLVDGQLVGQVGGGLCQLSSLLYHLGLMAGLTVIERHPHSVDIYQEADRYTPLGADATVVWGYKDLRFANPHGHPVLLNVSVEGHTLLGRVLCAESLAAVPVTFARTRVDDACELVATWVDGRVIAETPYLRRPGLAVTGGESGPSFW